MTRLPLAYSPCPNDTFVFHALVHDRVRVEGAVFEPVLLDIEALNLAASERRFPLTKVSVAAVADLLPEYAILDSGAALGRGVGPMIVRRADRTDLGAIEALSDRRIAIPGRNTTAARLVAMFAPADVRLEPMRFDTIFAAVEAGTVDAGVIIHEGRFTYQARGLVAITDLGTLWEGVTGLPLPLGVIVGRRDLGSALLGEVAAGISRSVAHAFADPEASRAYVRAHARELSDEVCRRHVELYVNDFSLALGGEGRAAVEAFLDRSVATGAERPRSVSPWV